MTLTDEQITLVFDQLLGVPVRAADIQVVRMLAEPDRDDRDILAEYIWDHWMGEPDSIDIEGVRALIDKVLS